MGGKLSSRTFRIYIHLNMQITSPVPSVPNITYISELATAATDDDGLEHTIIIDVVNPHRLESVCPIGTHPCLADGTLSVAVNGEEVLLAPGEVTVAPGVSIYAVKFPGACRSLGLEKCWERKKLESYGQSGRRLSLRNTMHDMFSPILRQQTNWNMSSAWLDLRLLAALVCSLINLNMSRFKS